MLTKFHDIPVFTNTPKDSHLYKPRENLRNLHGTFREESTASL